MGYKPFGFRMQAPRQQFLRPCWMNFWGQFKKQNNNGFSLQTYQPGMCTHIILELEWLQDEITGRSPTPVMTPESTSLQCEKIRKLISTVGLLELQSWTSNYCEFIELFTDGMTCGEVLSVVKSCTANIATVPKDNWASTNFIEKLSKLKLIDPEVKVLLSISPRTFGPFIFNELMNSTRRTEFIHAAVGYIGGKMDGLALDWDHSVWDKESYTSFVQELKFTMDELQTLTPGQSFEMALILPGDKQSLVEAYDMKNLWGGVSFAVLMPFNISNLWSKDLTIWGQMEAAQYCIEQGFLSNKLVFGAATFGYGWKISECGEIENATSKDVGATIPSYSEICDLIENGTYTVMRNQETDFAFPYLMSKNPLNPTLHPLLKRTLSEIYAKIDLTFSMNDEDLEHYYTDETTIINMVHYVKQSNFGGIMMIQPQFDDVLGSCATIDDRPGQPFPLTSIVAWELGGIKIGQTEHIEQDFFDN
ncbi:unnamed protein product, partial [Mesorhabditis belari]|uniref:GH18 domain-containing protein n=1 Tax=Mesorhabditis belari TaxID=2138241 RepID=A0AAF3J378_9BILA